MIEARDARVSFGKVQALKGVDVRVPEHGTVGIVGPNGCGKTTALRTLYGSLTPDSGTVTLDGSPIDALPRRTVARRVAVVVQESAPEIPISVADLAMMGRLPHHSYSSTPTAEDRRIVEDALSRVGLLEKATASFGALSGGERQRAMIARALSQRTDYILLDEPTNHLDIHYQHAVLNLVSQMPGGSAIVLHDLNLAARYCTEVVLMDEGTVVASGDPSEVFTPEVLEPVYRVQVRRIDDSSGVNLVFAGLSDAASAHAHAGSVANR